MTKKTTTSVSLVPKSRKEVPATIEFLKKQLEALKGNIKDKVSLDVSYNGTNIKNITSVSELIEISTSVQARSLGYAQELKRRGLEGKVQEFKTSGKTAAEWDQIIDKAINELINKVQIDKLEKAIKELSQHLDDATKLENTLKEIMGDAQQPLI